MQYFKNVELAKIYTVSEAAVRKWIKAAQDGKLDLELVDGGGKFYIANTTKNTALVTQLVERGKKYKNSRGRKIATPEPEFYKLYSRKQIFDIIANIDTHREIPLQYSYFDGGVEYWDKYASRLWGEDSPNMLNSTIELLRSNLSNIDRLIQGKTSVNVIDIGPGNGLPVKELLTHLVNLGVMARYIAIDISKEMLDVVHRNITQWFGDTVEFEGHVRDISYERFDDIIADETLKTDSSSRCNIILLLGATLINFRIPEDVLKTIGSSVGRKDTFLCSSKLDSPATRRYFDFSTESGSALAFNHRMLLDLLNINKDFYDVEMGYDVPTKHRYIRVRLKVALTITFKFAEGERTIDLNSGETILVWRAWHQTTHEMINQFESTGFSLLQASTTRSREYILVAAAIGSPGK